MRILPVIAFNENKARALETCFGSVLGLFGDIGVVDGAGELVRTHLAEGKMGEIWVLRKYNVGSSLYIPLQTCDHVGGVFIGTVGCGGNDFLGMLF